jgi:transmembrane sensor
MSAPGQEQNFAPDSAKEVRAKAAEWISRRDSGNWVASDRAALDEWLAQSPAHMIAFLRAEAGWARADLLGDLRHPAHEPPARAQRFPLLLKIAAVFIAIIAIGAAGAGFYLWPRERTYSTPIGGHEIVAFADGTRIELNTNTVLRARMTTDQRIVWLDKGEAFFQVKHDATHPFVVVAGNRRITDLGTKFLVRREPAKLEVAVAQGRVWFDAADKSADTQSQLLSPGDVALATATRVSVTRKSAQSIATELSWRKGMLVFKHTTLADAAAEFNRYNRQKLVIADMEAAARTIGGTFPTSDVELFGRVVHDVLGLRVENKGNEIVISAQGK